MYNSDRPLTDRQRDELGLAAVADAVAVKIAALQPAEGLVIGLQSPWGMGKSTFLNFLTEKLDEAPGTIVVRFAPWLVDNRDALLHELFTEMSRCLEPAEKRNAHRWDVSEYRNRQAIARRLRQFTRAAERMKSLPQAPHLSWFKDLFNLPVAREVGAVASFGISTAAAFKPKDETLRELRDDISARLSLLNRKIIVVVDDVDRLESAEAREVFRLIKAVADFPNTIYLVAFDREPLGFDKNYETDIARAFLDKIVQVPIYLPRPEAVDLRRILAKVLVGEEGRPGVINRPLREQNNPYLRDSEAKRLAAILDPLVRTYLNSPRRIGIIHNSLLTAWSSISDDVDAADYLIYLCVINFDSALASWIDAYLAIRASRGGGLRSSAATELRDRLEIILKGQLRHREDRMTLLRSLLPSMRGY